MVFLARFFYARNQPQVKSLYAFQVDKVIADNLRNYVNDYFVKDNFNVNNPNDQLRFYFL